MTPHYEDLPASSDDTILYQSQLFMVLSSCNIAELRKVLQNGPLNVPAKVLQDSKGKKAIQWALQHSHLAAWRLYWTRFVQSNTNFPGNSALDAAQNWLEQQYTGQDNPQQVAYTLYSLLLFWPTADADALAWYWLSRHESDIRTGLNFWRHFLHDFLGDSTNPLKTAQNRIAELEQQYARLEHEFHAMESSYTELLQDLMSQWPHPHSPATDEHDDHASPPDLPTFSPSGSSPAPLIPHQARILLLGDPTHASGYCTVVELLGGVPVFFEGYTNQLPQTIPHVNVACFITPGCSHAATVKWQQRLGDTPILLVRRAGLAALRLALAEYYTRDTAYVAQS